MKSPFRARTLLLCLGLAILLCAITPYNDYKIGATYLAGNQFPTGALFALVVLAAPVNALLRRFAPRQVFSRGELLITWILLLVSSGLPSSGMMRFLLPHLAAPQNFSNGANNWQARVWGKLPDWFRLSDPAAAVAYYSGYPRGHEHIPWEAWWRPLLAWGAFAVFFYIATVCVASLLRRQWVENERFVFPLVTLPLLLAEDPAPGSLWPPLFREKPLWAGVLFCTALHTLNGMHLLYPSVPAITTSIAGESFFTSPPWDQIGPVPINFYPLVVGLSYLLATEVSFSLWFFFLFFKTEALFAAVYNLDAPGSLGSPSERQFHALQSFGGALALLGWTLWGARHHLRAVWDAAMDGDPNHQFKNEMLSPRAIVFGLFIAYAGMGVWLYLATLPPVLILVSLLLVTVSLVTLSYLVTQAGTLYTIAPCMGVDAYGGIWGTSGVSPGAWYMNQRVEAIFYRDTRELLLPEILNSAKAADTSGIALRPLLTAIIVFVVIAIGVSLVSSLYLPYYNGGANSLPNVWTFRNGPLRPLPLTASLAQTPLPPNFANALHVIGGLVGTGLLLFMRARAGWGLHPIGFIGASVVAGRTLWFSVLVGWALKTLLLRFGGFRLFRLALPFFLGLILGDVLNAFVWIVLGALTGIGYNLLPS